MLIKIRYARRRLIIACIFLFTSRWACGLDGRGLISGSLQYTNEDRRLFMRRSDHRTYWLIQTHMHVWLARAGFFFRARKGNTGALRNFRFENAMIFENARRVGDYLPSSSFLRRENYTPQKFVRCNKVSLYRSRSFSIYFTIDWVNKIVRYTS